MSDIFAYVKNTTYDERVKKSDKILKNYPDKVPVILELNKGDALVVKNNVTSKYIVPVDLTIAAFQSMLRKKLELNECQSIYICCNSNILPGSYKISSVYLKHKSDDGFLYLKYCSENVFG
jgi:hypothetical protein